MMVSRLFQILQYNLYYDYFRRPLECMALYKPEKKSCLYGESNSFQQALQTKPICGCIISTGLITALPTLCTDRDKAHKDSPYTLPFITKNTYFSFSLNKHT